MEKQIPTDIANKVTEELLTEIVEETEWNENLVDCNFVYDTIASKKYDIHLGILDKFNNKEKRGYFFKSNGDTLNKFLYHQDIAVFALGLDSKEKGLYKMLTNKVVFLILEHEPKMLDGGLTIWTRKDEQLDYFMEHVSNPQCNTIPVDSIIDIIQKELNESTDAASRLKRRLINQLQKSKTQR